MLLLPCTVRSLLLSKHILAAENDWQAVDMSLDQGQGSVRGRKLDS